MIQFSAPSILTIEGILGTTFLLSERIKVIFLLICWLPLVVQIGIPSDCNLGLHSHDFTKLIIENVVIAREAENISI